MRAAPAHLLESPLVRAQARLRLEKMRAAKSGADERIKTATQSTAVWLQGYTKTFNTHWKEEGYVSPYLEFPDWDYFAPMLDIIEREPISVLEKSRDMMASWAVVGYFVLQAMLYPEREIIFQSKSDRETEQLVDYSKHLYDNQPDWLRDSFPLTKKRSMMASHELLFKNGSQIIGIPGGKDRIRSFHPWGFAQDESAFQPEGLQCIDAALGAGAMKIVMLSSANVGWFSEYRRS